jgi:histidinol phosphatase-like enzyme
MKICFLDIDGVINSEDYAIYRFYGKKFDLDEFIDERPIVMLNYIIEQTDAKVVLSSSWRRDWENTEKRLKAGGFQYNIFDVTPYDPNRFRGKEIKMWIDKYEKDHEPLESYVILDDDDDMLPEQENNFVHCNFQHGLTCKETYKAIDILNGDYNPPVYL